METITEAREDKKPNLFLQAKIEVVSKLKNLNCCSKCVLRYIGLFFAYPKWDINDLDIIFKERFPDAVSKGAKRIKRLPCISCLNILEESTIDNIVLAISASEVKYCSNETLTIAFNLPKCLLIRERCIRIYLRDNFPGYKDNQILPLQTVLRRALKRKIEQNLKKSYYLSSLLCVTCNISYQDDDKEAKMLCRLFSKSSRKPNSKKFMAKCLYDIDENRFKNKIGVIPSTPLWPARLKNIEIYIKPCYIGGKYFKFERNMKANPNFTDSIDILIRKGLKKVFKYDGEFTVKGIDSQDKCRRVLGNGRPFYIDIKTAEFEVTQEMLQELEKYGSNSGVLTITNLKIVYKRDLEFFNCGNFKHTYQFLCKTDAIDDEDVVEKINNYGFSEISQKTPIRNLRFRPLKERKKKIYKITAYKVPDRSDIFILDIEADHGFCFYSFVNGDFNRTCPSIAGVIGHRCSIVATDLLNVDFDWPDSVKNKKENVDFDRPDSIKIKKEV